MFNELSQIQSLNSQSVCLKPLHKNHLESLKSIAEDRSIWQHYIIEVSNRDNFDKEFEDAFIQREKQNQFPFVIFDKQRNEIIGSTRFLDIQPRHRKLEIGWTWLIPEYWGTSINAECKLLLLTFCFETLNLIRVQFKTDENNIRSRKAIEKIGGKFEGILRNDMLRENGTKRNSAIYSILDSEWGSVKPLITQLISSCLKK